MLMAGATRLRQDRLISVNPFSCNKVKTSRWPYALFRADSDGTASLEISNGTSTKFDDFCASMNYNELVSIPSATTVATTVAACIRTLVRGDADIHERCTDTLV